MIDDRDEEVADLLTQVVRSLVDLPEAIRVSSLRNEGGITFTIQADPRDVGKLIGKQGRTARALRTILGANAVRLSRSYSLDILDGGGDPTHT